MPILPQKECTGCTACAMLCPVAAITMEEDCEGFLRPKVAQDRCVGCGKCEKHCPMLTSWDTSGVPAYGVFAAKAKEASVHRQSQSGGAFYALANQILEQGGVVYGAALTTEFETEHIRVTDQYELRRLQGVKYIQSRLGDMFAQVAEDLKKGTSVLFSGTPCQVAGLKTYLEGKQIGTAGLLTADLVCYGVPSPGVFHEWLKCLEKAYGSRLAEMCYRRTDEKWGKGKERYALANGKVLEGSYFTGLYFRNLIIRPSCETCRFCNTARPGDLTLGDFWGIDQVMPEFYDDWGVSLVLCSTKKGQQALETMQSALDIRESNLTDAVAAQPRLQGVAVKPSTRRDTFWEQYRDKGLAYIAIEEGFIPPTLGYRLSKKLESIKRRLGKGEK